MGATFNLRVFGFLSSTCLKSTTSRQQNLSSTSKQTDIAPNFSMLCALNTPVHTITLVYIVYLLRLHLKDTDINCASNSVHICTAPCQPLLQALRFPQHNNMFQQADCIHSLVFILWPKPHSICHPLLSYSKPCLCDVHICRAQQQLAQKCP
jgi:hypothetical protein